MLPNSHPIKRIGFFIGEFMKKFFYGIGVNDADYQTSQTVDGKHIKCHFYTAWANMLKRCYCQKYQKTRKTYSECVVCDEWLSFSSFKKWMEKQDWVGKELDKDILNPGNKVYSPESCVFIDHMTNSFAIRSSSSNQNLTGSSYNRVKRKFVSRCSNPFTGKKETLGFFHTPEQAHLAWKRRKHELACQLADLQTDERVAKALRTRYL